MSNLFSWCGLQHNQISWSLQYWLLELEVWVRRLCYILQLVVLVRISPISSLTAWLKSDSSCFTFFFVRFVGCLGIVDHDVVELNNMHRQVTVLDLCYYLWYMMACFSNSNNIRLRSNHVVHMTHESLEINIHAIDFWSFGFPHIP